VIVPLGAIWGTDNPVVTHSRQLFSSYLDWCRYKSVFCNGGETIKQTRSGADMKTKAFGYVRVSGKGQLQGHGPKRQRDDIKQFARRNSLDLVHVYQDAWTGTDADRPQFVEMLETMIGNGVKTVLVESLDRFARDLAIQMQLISKLLSEGLTLVSANTGQSISTGTLDDNPMLKAMVQIQGVFAELDKSLIVRKLRKGRQIKRDETGRCEGRRPYGDRPGEAAGLERLKALHLKPRKKPRLTYAAIASQLNAERVPSRSGVPWTKGTVHAVAKRLGLVK